jgi:hypothetical protein
MRAGRALAMVMAAVSGLLSSAAAAQEDWKEEDTGDKPPPDDRPVKKKDAPKPDSDASPRRFLLDFKLGPAFSLSFSGVTEFSLQLHFGYAVSTSMFTPGDAFYLTVSPYAIIGERLTLVAPLGVQYDLPLKMIPYEGISAYARVSAGYAYFKQVGADFGNGLHGLGIQPALGAKLSFLDRFHVGIEPIGFDIITVFPPKSTNQSEATNASFQLYIFGGAKF